MSSVPSTSTVTAPFAAVTPDAIGDGAVTRCARNLFELVPDDTRMNTWHVALGFALLVDAHGRIAGAWRYGLHGVVPVRVYVA